MLKSSMQWFEFFLNTFIQISDMFHPNTDVKANLKLLTITELRSILQARTQIFESGACAGVRGVTGIRIYMPFYLIMLKCFPNYLKQ